MLSTPAALKLGFFYDDAFYDKHVVDSLTAARIFLAHLWSYLQPCSVLDVGCGRGAWLKACHELGATTLYGFDGDWNSQPQMIDDAIQFKAIDLNQPFALQERVDLAMTLEVAEHLKESSASRFVDCLTQAADAILFSAAYTKQGGTNHINEQPHSYWAKLFAKEGYVPFDLFRPVFWGDERIAYWYRQNAFLYVRKSSSVYQKLLSLGFFELANIEFMDCIHPTLYEGKLGFVDSGQNTGFREHVKDIIPSFFRAIYKRIAKNK